MPVQSEAATIHREYPSAMLLGPALVMASDGDGSLYALSLSLQDQGQSPCIGTFILAIDGRNSPFKIHHCHRINPTTAVAVISSKSKASSSTFVSKKHAGGGSVFDVRAIRINLFSLRPGSPPKDMDVIWHRQGEDIPILAQYVPELDSHVLVGGSTYPDPSVVIPAPYEPSPAEIAPIPRANENPDKSDSPIKPPPYSWTQTSDSITIAIPLPSSTSKDIVKVSFSPKTLTVHVDYRASASIPIPHYSAKELWDTISPSSSFWTWDREAEHSYGILSLHMENLGWVAG